MQQKQIQQKQITQKNITQRQFTRQNVDPTTHTMTLSNPQRDMRSFNIPSGTIVEEQPRKVRFAYLRSWITSLLALVALPLGAILILVGTAIADNLPVDWVSTTATVRSITDNETRYVWTVDGDTLNGDISRQWQSYFSPKVTGDLIAQVSLCDIASTVIVPREIGKEFMVWYDPQSPNLHQCVPMSQDAGTVFVIVGWMLVVFSLWGFLRIFHRAGVQLALANK